MFVCRPCILRTFNCEHPISSGPYNLLKLARFELVNYFINVICIDVCIILLMLETIILMGQLNRTYIESR